MVHAVLSRLLQIRIEHFRGSSAAWFPDQCRLIAIPPVQPPYSQPAAICSAVIRSTTETPRTAAIESLSKGGDGGGGGEEPHRGFFPH